MAVKRLFQSRQQFFDNSGNLASGYRLFFYIAGQQTKQSTYNSSSGLVANSNPIVLNARGESSTEIWGTVGQTYKVALAAPGSDDPPGAFVWTEDNVAAINDISSEITIDQWLPSGVVPTFISSTSFSIPGDRTSDFVPGRRIKTTNNGGTVYSTILTSAFTTLTTITVSNDSPGVLDSGLNGVSLGIITPTNSSMPWSQDDRLTIVDNVDTSKRLQFQLSGITSGQTRVITIPDSNFTPATLDTAQSFTNKTYVSPTFSGTASGSLGSPTFTGTTTLAAIAGNVIATQAQMEGAAVTDAVVTPGRALYHPGVAKAWGTIRYSGSTPTCPLNYNVSSISSVSTGTVDINLSITMSTSNYAVIAMATSAGGAVSEITANRTTSAFRLNAVVDSGSSSAPANVDFFFVVYGDI